MYCYLIKYRAKNLLPFQNTNNNWNKYRIDSINLECFKTQTLKTTHSTFLMILSI